MTKSLNQAFIRAYSKEKARSPAQPQVSSPKVYGIDDLIARFDTATCGSMPAPHLKSPKSSKEPVAAAVASTRPARVIATARREAARALPSAALQPDVIRADRPARREPSPMATHRTIAERDGQQSDPGDALRSAIAAQMSRAGDWAGASIGSFSGGDPVRKQEHPQQDALSANRNSQRDQAVKPAAVRELDSPTLQAPALSSQVTSGNHGEFFRLDRPSYAPAPAPLDEAAIDGQLSDSGELSSVMLDESSSHIDSENHPGASAAQLPEESVRAARSAQAQVVEHELRRAKVRIFNPVWEVDSFQWPDICLELLEQRAESLEVVARNLNDSVQEGLQVLAVTSPQGGEGRTTVACCLAKLAGSRGLNVAIVDGDIENPSLSYQTNLDVEQDWKSAILNQLPLEEIAVHSIDDQVTLVPLINSIDQSELSSGDNRIEFMLHELSESFDLVIVDMGHMSSPRSLVTSLGARGVISAVVAVVDHRTADAQQIDQCLRRIRQSGIVSVGVVENFAA